MCMLRGMGRLRLSKGGYMNVYTHTVLGTGRNEIDRDRRTRFA
jgi:hypothetical protein